MFHSDHDSIQIIGHLLIAFLFIFRCLTAIPRFAEHSKRLAARGIPLSNLVLTFGLGFMLVGGLSIAIDYETRIGGTLLILFTMAAIYVHHNFWDPAEPIEKNRKLYIACNNIAVIGGILLVISL
ncbi:MAG: DoxX family protein [Rhodospirillaceae bacterium]|jgi:putative oxidoreductase